MAKQVVGGTRPGGAYSPGIVAEGRFVYVSGQVSVRDGVVVGETAAEQTVVALDNVAAVLAEAGPACRMLCGVACTSATWLTSPR